MKLDKIFLLELLKVAVCVGGVLLGIWILDSSGIFHQANCDCGDPAHYKHYIEESVK